MTTREFVKLLGFIVLYAVASIGVACARAPQPLRTSIQGLRPPPAEMAGWDTTRITGGKMLVVRGPADLKCYEPTLDVDVTGRVVRLSVRSMIADRPCDERSWLTHYEAHVEGLSPGLWEIRVHAYSNPDAARTIRIG